MLYIDLIEDSDDDALIIETKLKKMKVDYRLTRFAESASAVTYYRELLQKVGPNSKLAANRMILLDLNLRNSSGFELLKFIESEPMLNQLIVIIITASTSKEDLRNSFKLGGCSYLVKPFKYEEFLETLQTLMITGRIDPKIP